MRKGISLFLTFSFFLLFFGITYAESKIRIIAENFPPYNYIENNRIKGLSVDVIKAVFNDSRIPYYIEVRSHVNAFEETLKNGNTFYISVKKNPENRNLFIFIGPIVRSSISVFSMKDIHISDLKQMQNYKTGASPADEDYFILNGFLPGKNLFTETGNNHELKNIRKLITGEIELLSINGALLQLISRQNNIDCSKFQKVYEIDDLGDGLYIAANESSSSDIIGKLNKSLNNVIKNGSFKDILLKWNVY